ncbi:MAG: hypothetical protein GXP35_17265 [Actinobacteria bacterium]|nr:hypothetical protein [Actinomycetota bacterium]
MRALNAADFQTVVDTVAGDIDGQGVSTWIGEGRHREYGADARIVLIVEATVGDETSEANCSAGPNRVSLRPRQLLGAPVGS